MIYCKRQRDANVDARVLRSCARNSADADRFTGTVRAVLESLAIDGNKTQPVC